MLLRICFIQNRIYFLCLSWRRQREKEVLGKDRKPPACVHDYDVFLFVYVKKDLKYHFFLDFFLLGIW